LHSNVAPVTPVKVVEAVVCDVGDEVGLVSVKKGSSGVLVSTVHVLLEDADVLPASSVCRTYTVCSPSARPVYSTGLVQATQDPVSSLHSRSAPDSPLKESEAVVEFVAEAAGLIRVRLGAAGAVVSTVHVVVEEGEILPRASF
jgi:hypothetical protein